MTALRRAAFQAVRERVGVKGRVGVRTYYRQWRVNLRYSWDSQFLADRQSIDGSSAFAGAVAGLIVSSDPTSHYAGQCARDLSGLSQGGSNLPGLTERRVQPQECAWIVGWI